MDRLIGKINWFSSRRNAGLLTSIGGIGLEFSSKNEVATTPFTRGQLVTYRESENGETTPFADDVRPQPE